MLQSLEPKSGTPPTPEVLPPAERHGESRVKLVFKAVLQTVIAFLILFGAFQGMNKLVATRPDVPKRPPQEKSYAVETVTVARGDHAPVINVFGETTAGREVDLRALVGGEIIEVHPGLKAGGKVEKGEVLVAIDQFDYLGALTEAEANLAEAHAALVENKGRVVLEEANLVRAREQLEFAQRDLQRAEELLGTGAITERTLDDRKLLLSQRQQNLEQTQNRLALEEAKVIQKQAGIDRAEWRLENAQRQLENTVLAAPFDAIVRTEAAELGRLVNVNDAVVSLYSSDEFEVRFTLSDNQYGRLIAENGTVVDRPVEVIWYLGDDPITFPAKVSRIGADVASARGGVDLIASIDTDDANVPLRPGAFVEVSLADRTYENSYRIPETAYYGDGVIYVVSDRRLEERAVTPLAIDDGFILVEGGLEPGETVLATRIPEAGTGLLVLEVDEAPTDAESEAKSTETSSALSGQ
ncbi:MAG: HlyD family efflux transporter periplasmic adaptor subunit [Roseibium sp.]